MPSNVRRSKNSSNENDFHKIQLMVCMCIIAETPLSKTPSEFATSLQRVYKFKLQQQLSEKETRLEMIRRTNESTGRAIPSTNESEICSKSTVKTSQNLMKNKRLHSSNNLQNRYIDHEVASIPYPKLRYEVPVEKNLSFGQKYKQLSENRFPQRQLLGPQSLHNYQTTEPRLANQTAEPRRATRLPDPNFSQVTSVSDLELLWNKAINNNQIENNQSKIDYAQRLMKSLAKNPIISPAIKARPGTQPYSENPEQFYPQSLKNKSCEQSYFQRLDHSRVDAVSYQRTEAPQENHCDRLGHFQSTATDFPNSWHFNNLYSRPLCSFQLKRISAFEVINVRVFYGASEDKTKAIQFILVDFYETLRSVFSGNLEFPEALSCEITKILEESASEGVLTQCVTMSVISFYQLTFQFLIQSVVENKYNLVMKVFNFIKHLDVLGPKFVMTCGYYTTCLICDLLQQGPEGFPPEIEYYLVDLLRSFIRSLNDVKNQSNQDERADKLSCTEASILASSCDDQNSRLVFDKNKSWEAKLNMVDRALAALSKGSPELVELVDRNSFDSDDIFHNYDSESMTVLWRKMLQSSLESVSGMSVFVMQVKSLIELSV